MWCVIPQHTLARAGLSGERLAGGLHAAEHAAIGLLPMLATCDRLDLGGLSTIHHPDTGGATIFIHDAIAGGAGFAERAFGAHRELFRAVGQLLARCPCQDGCPACIQSPKCGNANQVLSKSGALDLVKALTQE
jgi:DEAD/DEAH box helicase domain-containing protein